MKKTCVLIGIGIVLASGIIMYGGQDKVAYEAVCSDSMEQTVQNYKMDNLDTVKVASINADHDEPTSQNGVTEEGHVEGLHLDAAESESDPELSLEADPIPEPKMEGKPAEEKESETDAPLEGQIVRHPSSKPEAQGLTMEDFRKLFIDEKINLVKNPVTQEAFEAIFLHMSARNLFTYSIDYEGLGFEEVTAEENLEAITGAFDVVFNRYPEYMSFTNRIAYQVEGDRDSATLTLILSSDTRMDQDSLARYRERFFLETVEIVEKLTDEGRLYPGQPDWEKALVLFDWVVQNTEYDNELHAESYTGYSVYANRLAVCQGYTAAYNALCKAAGVQVEGVGGLANGEEHIWTRALFAGQDVYIDATWGDSYVNSDESNYDFFVVDGETLAATHAW